MFKHIRFSSFILFGVLGGLGFGPAGSFNELHAAAQNQQAQHQAAVQATKQEAQNVVLNALPGHFLNNWELANTPAAQTALNDLVVDTIIECILMKDPKMTLLQRAAGDASKIKERIFNQIQTSFIDLEGQIKGNEQHILYPWSDNISLMAKNTGPFRLSQQEIMNAADALYTHVLNQSNQNFVDELNEAYYG